MTTTTTTTADAATAAALTATAADAAAARAASKAAKMAAVAAHAAAAFAANAAEDALACAAACADDPSHAAAHRWSASSWSADADGHREEFHLSMAEAVLWDRAAAAADAGAEGRIALARALVALMRADRIDADRAIAVVANPRAGVAYGEVVIDDPDDGVGYSLWGSPVCW